MYKYPGFPDVKIIQSEGRQLCYSGYVAGIIIYGKHFLKVVRYLSIVDDYSSMSSICCLSHFQAWEQSKPVRQSNLLMFTKHWKADTRFGRHPEITVPQRQWKKPKFQPTMKEVAPESFSGVPAHSWKDVHMCSVTITAHAFHFSEFMLPGCMGETGYWERVVWLF